MFVLEYIVPGRDELRENWWEEDGEEESAVMNVIKAIEWGYQLHFI